METVLNQSQGGMCICRVLGIGAAVSRDVSALDVQDRPGSTSSFRLASPVPTLSCTGAIVLSPIIGVEVRAVAPDHQPQLQLRREVLPHRACPR